MLLACTVQRFIVIFYVDVHIRFAMDTAACFSDAATVAAYARDMHAFADCKASTTFMCAVLLWCDVADRVHEPDVAPEHRSPRTCAHGGLRVHNGGACTAVLPALMGQT